MRTALGTSHVAVEAGSTARVEIEVTNTSDVIDGIVAIVDGLNPEWVSTERPLVRLFPDTTDTVVIHIDVPRTCRAGDYLVNVHVVSAVDPLRESIHDFWLTVEPHTGLDLELRPSILRAGSRGTCWATVRNTGNCDLAISLHVDDPTREVDATIVEPERTLPYEHLAPVEIELRGRRPWFGEPAVRLLTVEARSGDVVVERPLTFSQRPRIPRGVLTALVLAAIITLWVLIFVYAIGALRAGGDPPKAVAGEIATGAENIELALIRGTVAGSVSASTTGEGIPSVTVEAFRIKQFPNVPGEPAPDPAVTLSPVASGGTDENGDYLLRTLIPGKYLLRFSASGYAEVWLPGDLASGRSLAIAPLDPVRAQDVVMEGALASVQVQLDLPDGTDPSQLTARITPADGGSLSATSGLVQTDGGGTCVIDAQALVTCTGLPTPGEYLIAVSGPGFDGQRIPVDLSGGADTVVDTVQVAGELGDITGSVIDQDGAPLVGATVSVSSGQFVARVFTDRGGRFVVDDLPTPADYVVDISLPGYVGRTIALPLAAGGSSSVPAQQLVGGVGSINGAVVDEAGNRLPGVQIELSGERSTAVTASLTDGDVGSFSFRDLAVPGTYSIAFSLPGYLTETRLVTFEEAGLQPVGDVRMSTSFGRVEGSVVDPTGDPVAGAQVQLLDGLRTRTTTTSSGGIGSFGFSDVTPGSYTIVVQSTNDPEDVKVWVAQRDVVAGETMLLDRIVLPLEALGTIQGVVNDPAGVRLAGVGVTLVGEGRTETTVSRGPGPGVGTFDFAGLDVPGTYELTFTLADHGTVVRTVSLAFTNGAFVQSVNPILVPDPGPVSGIVEDDVGEPVDGASVTVTDAAGTVHTVATDSFGTFELPSVAAGPAVIDVTYVGPDDEAGAVADLSFVVPPGGGVIPDPITISITAPAVPLP